MPDITDVRKILDIFRALGSQVKLDETTRVLDLHHRDTRFDAAVHRLPEEMRSSIMLVPPLLARFGVARLEDNVKGCTLGVREIDPHVDIFRSFGGQVERADGSLLVRSSGPLHPTHHWLDYASVTTTENFVLCARRARRIDADQRRVGTARAGILPLHGDDGRGHRRHRHLAAGGARRRGAQGRRVHVRGRLPRDHHLPGAGRDHRRRRGGAQQHAGQFPLIDRTFAKFGVRIEHKDGWSRAFRDGPLKVQTPFTSNVLTKVEAAPWPYFPVDLLPIFIALGVCAEGNAMFWNKVYDGALGWTGELSKFGAHVFSSDPHRVVTFGGNALTPAVVESPYIIRVAIALFMVASSIKGRSEIRNATPIRRAHPRFVENLRSLGVQVEWANEE